MQMEQTQLGPPGPEGYYDQQMGGAYAGQTTWDTNAQGQYQAAATWDDSQAIAGGNANNPFAPTAAAYDPNTAWDDGSATGNGYGNANGTAGDAFYETRAQYVQPTSNHAQY